MIDEINNLLANVSRFQDDLNKLENTTKITQELLRRAEDVKLVSEVKKTAQGHDVLPTSALCWSLVVMPLFAKPKTLGTKTCYKNSTLSHFFRLNRKQKRG